MRNHTLTDDEIYNTIRNNITENKKSLATPRTRKMLKNNDNNINNNNNKEQKTLKFTKKNNIQNDFVPETPKNKRKIIDYSDDENHSKYIPETPQCKRKILNCSEDENSEELLSYNENLRMKVRSPPNKRKKLSLENFHITPMSFYSKKSIDLNNSENKENPKESPEKSANDINKTINNISSKVSNLLNKNKRVQNLKKKVISKKNKNIFKYSGPKLGNTGVTHGIKFRNFLKKSKIKIPPGKEMKLVTKHAHNSKCVNVIVNKSKKPLNIEKISNKNKNLIENSSESEEDSDSDWSDFSTNIDESLPEKGTAYEEEVNNTIKRKFFKNKNTVKNHFQAPGNLKLTMCKGQIIILPEEKSQLNKKKKRKNKFSKERNAVKNILERLSYSPELKSPNGKHSKLNKNETNEENDNLNNNSKDDCVDKAAIINSSSNETNDKYVEFRNRLPYNTNDPKIIEQQNLLLDFLILCDICTEENFKIFIAEQEKYKEEASKIIDSLTVVCKSSEINNKNDTENTLCELENVNYYAEEMLKQFTDFQSTNKPVTNNDVIDNSSNINVENVELELDENINKITEEHNEITKENNQEINDFNSKSLNNSINNPENNLKGVPASSSKNFEDFDKNPIKEDVTICKNTQMLESKDNTKLFPIFYTNNKIQYETLKSPVIQRKSVLRGFGINQFQIDAGQKEFGAKQCKQCGLLYSVHEPEDEKLHMEYHEHLNVLKFKGWSDEDIVEIYPEWGPGSRIIKITDVCNIKRKERLLKIINVIDKELGFASYTFPKKFLAFLAIKQSQIVGVCLVQPLEKANRYICIDGVDCCTEELFDAKCGISRIWTSPLHRRIGIASKLISAVQTHTIPGEKISLEKIAFSAPTEDGKAFAFKITKRNDFLVYEFLNHFFLKKNTLNLVA